MDVFYNPESNDIRITDESLSEFAKKCSKVIRYSEKDIEKWIQKKLFYKTGPYPSNGVYFEFAWCEGKYRFMTRHDHGPVYTSRTLKKFSSQVTMLPVTK